jgi:hypothetical protein
MLHRIETLIQKYLNAEFVSQVVIIGIPAWFAFILTFNTEVFATSPAYDYMERLGSQQTWAAITTLLVLICAPMAASNKKYPLIIANLALSFWHLVMASCIFLGSPQSTGSGTYLIIAWAAGTRSFWVASRR